MLSSLLLGFHAVAVFLSTVRSSPVEELDHQTSGLQLDASSLQYIYAFFRHGIRSPLVDTYPNDPNKEKYDELFQGNFGKLTKVGIKQMYGVGQRLKAEYGKFLGEFSEEKVRASSTSTSRTIMTALSVMAGLFPPKEPLVHDLNWQPIPIWQDTTDFDKAYFYIDPKFPTLALETCPKFGEMIRTGFSTVMKKDRTQGREKIYELLRKHTGKSNINSINTAYEICDILKFASLHGLPLPEWATRPQEDYQGQPLYPNLLTPLMVEWFYDCQWLNRDPEMLLFYSGPLFDSINDHFKEKIKNPTKLERFRFHDTHDDTIYTLRWALGFDDPNFDVAPGDGIVFELHKKKVGSEDNYFVQVAYYHSLYEGKDFKEVLQLPGCNSPCPYETFSKLYQSLTPHQWQEKCKKL